MQGKAFVAGVGMIPFGKPGATDSYDVMGAAAVRLALADAGLAYSDVAQAMVGYVYGDSTSGQHALYHVGHDRHPGHQREQQLLDRLDRAVPRAPGRRIRRGGLRAGARVRADAARRADRALDRPPVAVRRFRPAVRRDQPVPGAAGAALFRRGRGRVHDASTARGRSCSPRSGPRRAATPRTIRSRCSARW